MALTANVVAGTKILSAWGNEIRDRTLQVFANIAERDSQWPTAPNGSRCITLDTYYMYLRQAGAWVQIESVRHGGICAATQSVAPGSLVPFTTMASEAMYGGATVWASGINVAAGGLYTCTIQLTDNAGVVSAAARCWAQLSTSPDVGTFRCPVIPPGEDRNSGSVVVPVPANGVQFGVSMFHTLAAATSFTARLTVGKMSA